MEEEENAEDSGDNSNEEGEESEETDEQEEGDGSRTVYSFLTLNTQLTAKVTRGR